MTIDNLLTVSNINVSNNIVTNKDIITKGVGYFSTLKEISSSSGISINNILFKDGKATFPMGFNILTNGLITNLNSDYLRGCTVSTAALDYSDLLIPTQKAVRTFIESKLSQSTFSPNNDLTLNGKFIAQAEATFNSKVKFSAGIEVLDTTLIERLNVGMLNNKHGYDYALLDSPVLTGNPKAPTQSTGNKSQSIATTEFVSIALDECRSKIYQITDDIVFNNFINTIVLIIVNTSAKAIAITLPTTISIPICDVRVVNIGTNNVTININGTSNLLLPNRNRSYCWGNTSWLDTLVGTYTGTGPGQLYIPDLVNDAVAKNDTQDNRLTAAEKRLSDIEKQEAYWSGKVNRYFSNTYSELSSISGMKSGDYCDVLDDGSGSAVYKYTGTGWTKWSDTDVSPDNIAMTNRSDDPTSVSNKVQIYIRNNKLYSRRSDSSIYEFIPAPLVGVTRTEGLPLVWAADGTVSTGTRYMSTDAGTFRTYPNKVKPSKYDTFLIEDSEDIYNKKNVTLNSLLAEMLNTYSTQPPSTEKNCQLITSTELDACVATGMYQAPYTIDGTAFKSIKVLHLNVANDNATQLAFGEEAQIWIRSKPTGTWGPWRSISDSTGASILANRLKYTTYTTGDFLELVKGLSISPGKGSYQLAFQYGSITNLPTDVESGTLICDITITATNYATIKAWRFGSRQTWYGYISNGTLYWFFETDGIGRPVGIGSPIDAGTGSIKETILANIGCTSFKSGVNATDIPVAGANFSYTVTWYICNGANSWFHVKATTVRNDGTSGVIETTYSGANGWSTAGTNGWIITRDGYGRSMRSTVIQLLSGQSIKTVILGNIGIRDFYGIPGTIDTPEGTATSYWKYNVEWVDTVSLIFRVTAYKTADQTVYEWFCNNGIWGTSGWVKIRDENGSSTIANKLSYATLLSGSYTQMVEGSNNVYNIHGGSSYVTDMPLTTTDAWYECFVYGTRSLTTGTTFILALTVTGTPGYYIKKVTNGIWTDWVKVLDLNGNAVNALSANSTSNYWKFLPIGFEYVQRKGQNTPATLFGGGTWANISSEYAGLFERIEGGVSPNIAATFGSTQGDTGQHHIHSLLGSSTAAGGSAVILGSGSANGPILSNTGISANLYSAQNTLGQNWLSDTNERTSDETRPANSTVRIWRLTSY